MERITAFYYVIYFIFIDLSINKVNYWLRKIHFHLKVLNRNNFPAILIHLGEIVSILFQPIIISREYFFEGSVVQSL